MGVAVIVKVVVTGVIPSVVLTVKVVVTSAPVLVIVFAGFPDGIGANDADAPVGNVDVLSVAVQELLLPLKLTVTE